MYFQLSDLVLTSLVMTPSRYENMDFPHPFMEEAAVLVIPAPDASNYIGSIWKPFEPFVIICSLIVILSWT